MDQLAPTFSVAFPIACYAYAGEYGCLFKA